MPRSHDGEGKILVKLGFFLNWGVKSRQGIERDVTLVGVLGRYEHIPSAGVMEFLTLEAGC
ncbi:MAG: hypothetical protein NZM25_04030 [Leptospiraceae bacterium]|nr:hypothetical protein [Leptospiraceae bacterium]MDW8306155.1 hypothetical protein [Leptospiraceae bacterium]